MLYRVVFCGTPQFAVPALESLIESDRYEVLMVLTQPDRPAGRGKKLQPSPVKLKAQEHGLPVLTPASVRDPHLIEQLQQLDADVGVVVAYGQILPADFFAAFKQGCVNIHGSLLPRWRGAAPIQRAVMAGDKETGVSLQKMVVALDAGDVIGERKIRLTPDVGAKELYHQLSLLGADLLQLDLSEYLQGRRKPLPQDESLATYAKKISKDEGLIDWTRPAWEVHNKVRGLNAGGPYATTWFRDKQIKLHKTQVVEGEGAPGSLIHVGKDRLIVACADQGLEILDIQPESKSRMSAGEFVRGFQVKEGEKFGFAI